MVVTLTNITIVIRDTSSRCV